MLGIVAAESPQLSPCMGPVLTLQKVRSVSSGAAHIPWLVMGNAEVASTWPNPGHSSERPSQLQSPCSTDWGPLCECIAVQLLSLPNLVFHTPNRSQSWEHHPIKLCSQISKAESASQKTQMEKSTEPLLLASLSIPSPHWWAYLPPDWPHHADCASVHTVDRENFGNTSHPSAQATTTAPHSEQLLTSESQTVPCRKCKFQIPTPG